MHTALMLLFHIGLFSGNLILRRSKHGAYCLYRMSFLTESVKKGLELPKKLTFFLTEFTTKVRLFKVGVNGMGGHPAKDNTAQYSMLKLIKYMEIFLIYNRLEHCGV